MASIRSKSRPRTAEYSPKEAIDALTILGQQITKTNEEWQRVCKAQELLDMELGDGARTALRRRAGVICRVLTDGTIRVGDPVDVGEATVPA